MNDDFTYDINGLNFNTFDISDSDFYVDYYANARDSYLESRVAAFPDADKFVFRISFTINPSAKNGVLVHAILDALPNSLYTIEKSSVLIVVNSSEFGVNVQLLSDILSVVKNWSTTSLICDHSTLDYTGFYYLVSYYRDKVEKNDKPVWKRNIKELTKKYLAASKHTHNKKNNPIECIPISRDLLDEALDNVIRMYIGLYGEGMEIQHYKVWKRRKVVVLEDSLVVYFWILPRYWGALGDPNHRDWTYPYIMIQELTHNDLFKFNWADFKRHFICDYIGIDFHKYHGLGYYNKQIDRFEYVNKRLPELKLLERHEQYPGEIHHFVILKIEDVKGTIHYGVGRTTGTVHTYVLKLCKELETKNSRSLELNGVSCMTFAENRDFVAAFLSWKGKKKRWRLENKFSYACEDIRIKNDIDLYDILFRVIKNAYNGAYNDYEFGSYSKPLNKWKSEELVYHITKKLYKDYIVIYQHSPFYLATDKGCMSYDIYICELKIAIEYQGKQHFEPVDYFGGKESFEKQKERDKLKAKRSQENGVNLIYINYWESITPDLIKRRVEEAIASKS